MAKISKIKARQILDSRGEWTIEVRLKTSDGKEAVASVPQGKSTGSHEARAVPARDGVRNIEKIIGPKLKRKDPLKQKGIDDFLIKLDGTLLKKRLGGNAMLGVSMAVARAGAFSKGAPLWKHLRDVSDSRVSGGKFPRLYINVVNGGLHAGNNLDFQEYMVIPKSRAIAESVGAGTAVYRALGNYLAKTRGAQARNLGDEGGYAPDFKNNLEPFGVLKKVVKSLGLEGKVDFGMDAAASGVKISGKKLFSLYTRMEKNFGLIYLEDPFGEEEFGEFAKLKSAFGSRALVAGDDLTTTNVSRMRLAEAQKSVNAVIIKPNQIGTVSEALEAVKLARQYGWAVVASHRSGETNDDFIADFAYGVGADGLKLGSPARGERVAKYNRLLEIGGL
ncbi:MAG: phosphopyruvate hydratase [Candidatus Liptonbacteria bacterium]|nr:phosphopyruvate hydratase [Candidatus Liptonbacteria bacterium]